MLHQSTADLGDRHMVDQEKIQQAVRLILEAIGEDPEREGLKNTPHRVAKMYADLFWGLHQDIGKPLEVLFSEDHDEMILVRDIWFYSMCEHHLLPFIGKVHVAYIPRSGKVTGLSKLARVVEGAARQPQMQERLTTQVADAMMQRLDPKGVAVVAEAEHLCMSMRGIQKPGHKTITSAVRGVFKTDEKTRLEVLSLMRPYGN